MSELTQGLIVTIFGLGLLFAALSLIVLLMMLLTRFFPAPKRSARAEPASATSLTTTAEEEIAAAIAVALTYWRSQDSGQNDLGSTLKAGRGPWWLRGQAQQFSSIARRRN